MSALAPHPHISNPRSPCRPRCHQKMVCAAFDDNAHFEVCDEAGDGAQVVEKSYQEEADICDFQCEHGIEKARCILLRKPKRRKP